VVNVADLAQAHLLALDALRVAAPCRYAKVPPARRSPNADFRSRPHQGGPELDPPP